MVSRIKYIRVVREENVARCWCVPEADQGEQYMNFPALDSTDTVLQQKLSWWNELLASLGPYKVVAGTTNEFTLTSKKGWF